VEAAMTAAVGQLWPAAVREPWDGGSRLFAAGDRAGYAGHLAAYGPLPGHEPLGTLLAQLQASGLTGRGGAAFPAGPKLAAVAQAGGTARYATRPSGPVLIANGAEGEPLSFKDATLLHNAPHLVIDGLLATAQSVAASAIYIYTAAGNLDAVAAALTERPDAAGVILVESPDAFVAGQASAAVNFLETGRALPVDLRRRLADSGFKGLPTLVQNVETWAQVALIARYGADWFRAAGVAGDPGTRLVSLSGDVPAQQVLEVPGGALLTDVLATAGIRHDAVAAVLVGGFHGRWVRPEGVVLSVNDGTAGLGAGLAVRPGAGVLHVLAPGRCGLAATADMVDYLAGQSARQCGPCMFGLPALADVMRRLASGGSGGAAGRGAGARGLVDEVGRLSRLVSGRGACHHPDGTVRLIASALETFADDIPWHLAGQCNSGHAGHAAVGHPVGNAAVGRPGVRDLPGRARGEGGRR